MPEDGLVCQDMPAADGWEMECWPRMTVPSSSSAPSVMRSSVQMAGSTCEPSGMRATLEKRKMAASSERKKSRAPAKKKFPAALRSWPLIRSFHSLPMRQRYWTLSQMSSVMTYPCASSLGCIRWVIRCRHMQHQQLETCGGCCRAHCNDGVAWHWHCAQQIRFLQ